MNQSVWKKVAIVHYRIGKTDGVSLEIMKRKQALEKLGYLVKLISGPEEVGADYIIPELEFDRPDIVKIKNNSFFEFKDYPSEDRLEDDILRVSLNIEEQFLKIHEKEHFDYLFLHNIFTHARHIAAARSFYNVVLKTGIKTIAVDHDFWWVGSYRDLYKPQTQFAKDFLAKYVPPDLPQISHVTLNRLNQKALEERIGAQSLIIPDTFDFEQPAWELDDYNRDFLASFGIKSTDLIVLQATRLSVRKGIELAVDFVAELTNWKNEFVGKTLYNGKSFERDSNIVFVLAGYPEKDSLPYEAKLKDKIGKAGVDSRFIYHQINSERRQEADKKIYSLWDAYVFADLVTFTSLWEGWGNQFIEAVFAKKPIAVFEYPVFVSDIKPEGFKVISLGNELAGSLPDGFVFVDKPQNAKATEEAIQMLTDPGTNQILEANFAIGREHHSLALLETQLKKLLESDS